MANQNNAYLNNNSAQVTLRDWQHAARMFTDSNQIFGPKQKFLFHVSFHINKGALRNLTLANTYNTQINMLVKSISLPKYSITTDKVNQYNRKKNIQSKISYEDITVKFHDDNLGLINQLWQNYYNYYYADPSSAGVTGAFAKTAIKKFNNIRSTYGLDNGSSAPFFDYITIYQLAQGQYVSYKLINPIFSSWSHNQLDYAGSAVHDNDATIQYEAVEYGAGKVVPGDPEGFALQNYDLAPSPLNSADLTNTVIDDISTTPNLDGIGVIPANKSSIIDNKLRTVNNYLNNKDPNKSVRSNLTNLTSNLVSSVTNYNNNNTAGISFPSVSGTTTSQAVPSGLTGYSTQGIINQLQNPNTSPQQAAQLSSQLLGQIGNLTPGSTAVISYGQNFLTSLGNQLANYNSLTPAQKVALNKSLASQLTTYTQNITNIALGK